MMEQEKMESLVTDTMLERGGEQAWCEGVNANADHLARLSWILDSFGAGSRVLDVGSGSGYITKRLRDKGVDARGIEPTERWRSFARERYGDFYSEGVAERIPYGDCEFDGALLGEVLEHLDYPLSALWETNRILKPKGRLVVTFPSTWHSIDEPDHVRYIDPKEGRYLLERTGFVVAAWKYNDHFWFYSSVKCSG